ncbi:reticulocalbin-2-like [Actinia tenebrosa]|uniref:Reticulocalbin-3 n=1 Tax=Actinia tenebrosa TaxID=6105 RepID=A0A6P8HTH4_ACTTE|nr:reticulocalbin-2-like [Actinia tenebrosa]
MPRSYLYLENMIKIFLLVSCFRVLVGAIESTPFGDVDESSDFADEDSEIYEDEPIDHSAFLQIDNTADLHIPKQTKRMRNRIRVMLKEMDSNHDGKVSEKELSDWIEKVMTEYLTSEGQKQMPKIDKDNDGLASWAEYAAAAGYTQGDAPEPRQSSEKSKKRDKEKFDLADTNKDDKLSYYELGVMIHPNEAPQMSRIVVTEFLEVMDRDRDGQLSFNEFTGEDPSLPTINEDAKKQLKKVFKGLDFDQDGKLNNEELIDWLLPNNKLPHQSEAENMMRDIDDDEDGALTAEEIFKHYNKFATSRATRYGRMLKDEVPPEDDEALLKKTKKGEKQNEKAKEEKKDGKADERRKEDGESKTKQDESQSEKAKGEKKKNDGEDKIKDGKKDSNKNGRQKPVDEL